MADLGLNTLWKDIDGGASTVSTDIMGPSYDYSANIPSPSSQGVGSDGSFGQVGSNVSAITTYIKYMISGPALGNQYFINTGGTCIDTTGKTQSRYNYINNKAVGSDLIPQGMNDLSFLTSDLNGLVPGIVGDLEGLDPLYLFSALTADASPPCDCYSCEVTDGQGARFLTPSLSPDFDTNLCQKVDASQCAAKESFTNYSQMSAVPTLLAGVGLIFLLLK